MLPPNWVKGGTERVQRFFFTIPVRTLWGAASRPLLYILSQYCDPPAAIYGWPLKCTLQHSGFGTANCNNFYNPRTSLDVTPTPPPSYPTATLTHLGKRWKRVRKRWWVRRRAEQSCKAPTTIETYREISQTHP